jgi:hypothetical protein
MEQQDRTVLAFAKMAALSAIALMATAPTWGAPPVKDTLLVTGGTDSAGFTPSVNPNDNQYHYATTVCAGSSVADTIPIELDLSNDNLLGSIFTVTLQAVGQIASSVTVDGPFTMTAPSSATGHAFLNTTSLFAPSNHTFNVQIDANPSNGVTLQHATLHVLVHVIDCTQGPPPPSCFLTDSSGLFLTDCSGNAVESGGEFLIIVNQKKITATNPGQFYYNFVWTNKTGGPVTFTSLGLVGTNVVPTGTNSVHVLIYDASSFIANFDDVNTSGVPCGTNGAVCKTPITVPDGDTLWLTWHVAYNGLKLAAPLDLKPLSACPAVAISGDATISMSATLTGDITVGPCSASANGYTIQ